MGRRLVVVGAALALLAPGAARTTTAGGADKAFVSAERDDLLVGVELDTSRITARIPVPRGPHNVAVSSDRRFVLVTSPPAGAVTLVDSFSERVLHVFRHLASPHDAAFSPDGRRAYVTEESGRAVAVLDVKRRRLARRIPVGPRPHDLAVSPDGGSVWVTERSGLAIVDAAAGRVVGRGGARRAHDIAFDRSGRFVWVTYWDSGLVGKIRAYRRTGRLRLQESAGTLVHHIEVDPVGRVWVSDHGRGEARRLSRWSGRTLQRLTGCPGAHHVGVGPGRGRVAVACHDTGTILVWDSVERKSTQIRVGRGPHGVVVAFVP